MITFLMSTINKTAVSITAGLAGTLFIGYCIYFDRKRRTDPDYKKKVRERRRSNRKNGKAGRSGIPNFTDQEQIERYFLQEIQWGETLIARGEFESGVGHLINAVLVCGRQAPLLEMLQASLPPQVFAMLIIKMQELGNPANADINDTPKIASFHSTGSSDSVNEHNAGQPDFLIDDLEQ